MSVGLGVLGNGDSDGHEVLEGGKELEESLKESSGLHLAGQVAHAQV